MAITSIPISISRLATTSPSPVKDDTPAGLASSFSQVLSGALKQVSDLAQQADDLSQKLATGQVSDAHTVTIASEKATLALQLTVEIRNKVVEAYQEIMRMPL